MSSFLKIVFWGILLFSLYHVVRDLLQIVGVENMFTTIFHWPHTWCGWYCDWVMLPLELGAIAGATLVLRRNRVGLLGIVTMCFPPLLFLGTILLN